MSCQVKYLFAALRQYLYIKATFTLVGLPDRFRSDVKKHLTVPFIGTLFFRGIIATERCCFAQLLKVVHSVSRTGAFSRQLSGMV
jgi:hypothetical protein